MGKTRTMEIVSRRDWFNFVLSHCVRPYQGCKDTKDFKGWCEEDPIDHEYIVFRSVQVKSPMTGRKIPYKKRFISKSKMAEFSLECNQLCNNAVIDRVTQIWQRIRFTDHLPEYSNTYWGFGPNDFKLIEKISSSLKHGVVWRNIRIK
jgi:hypothetical protein